MCMKFKATQAVQPMLPREVSNRPWQDIAADFFNFNGREHLLLIDKFSKDFFIHKTSSETTDTIIKKLQEFILQYSPPRRLSTDNRSLFSAEPLAKFVFTTHQLYHLIPHVPKVKLIHRVPSENH